MITITIARGSQYTDANNPSRIKKNALAGLDLPPNEQIQVVIEDGIQEIGKDAFYGCTNLEKVKRMNGVRRIGRCAFSGCTGLRSITFPPSVQTICDGAFLMCTALKQISIPKSIVEIGESAFAECTAQVEIRNYRPNVAIQRIIINPWIRNQQNDDSVQVYDIQWVESYEERIINAIQDLMHIDYRWNEEVDNGEIETINRFNRLSLLLKHAIQCNDNPSLIVTILKILEWGKVTRSWHTLVPDFYQVLSDPNNRNLLQQDNPDFAFAARIGLGNSNRISTWSKILAAYRPGTFFIYDSRVASALSEFAPENQNRMDWRIPAAANAQVINGNSVQECYHAYHAILRRLAEHKIVINAYTKVNSKIREAYRAIGFSQTQAIMAHLEKMLFMKGE